MPGHNPIPFVVHSECLRDESPALQPHRGSREPREGAREPSS